jgi:uncharacterized protein (DUF58 family)
VSSEARATFPLIPRHRLNGLPFGQARSLRRGRGSDLAGSRPYIRGDPISAIDWRASARLSTARGNDEFVVRERFAEEAPNVVAVVDRRPSMALYPEWSPWLSKRRVMRFATAAIIEAAVGARGAAGYLDFASVDSGGGESFWIAPRSRSPLDLVEERFRTASFDAGERSLEHGIEYLAHTASALGAGSFVFVLSDFLEPPPASLWLKGLARRWELVPVVIQDPVWEQTFPSIGPVSLPLVDPRDDAVFEVRFRRSEARAERERREQARTSLLESMASLGLDPVVIDKDDRGSVERAFSEWAEDRRRDLHHRR